LKVDEKIILEFTKEIRKKLNKRIKKIVLFGSRARNDHREDSDYDFLIVVDRKNTELREDISKIAADIGEKYTILIAPVIRSEDIYTKSQNSPFQLIVKEEGIIV